MLYLGRKALSRLQTALLGVPGPDIGEVAALIGRKLNADRLAAAVLPPLGYDDRFGQGPGLGTHWALANCRICYSWTFSSTIDGHRTRQRGLRPGHCPGPPFMRMPLRGSTSTKGLRSFS